MPGLTVAAAVLMSVVMLAAVVGCGGEDEATDDTTAAVADEQLSGYTREPTPSAAEVEVPLVNGEGMLPVTAAPGGLRLVYFGYTTCPDVCPTTMSDVKRALAKLPPEDSDRVDVVMVTIDPDRDVDAKLGAYVGTFIENGAASRITDPAELEATAGVFGAQYSVETTEDGEIDVSHSGDLYAVDDRGDIVLQWPFGIPYEDLSADIAVLLADSGAA